MVVEMFRCGFCEIWVRFPVASLVGYYVMQSNSEINSPHTITVTAQESIINVAT